MSKHKMERFFKKHIALVLLVAGAAIIAGLLLTQTKSGFLAKSQVVPGGMTDPNEIAGYSTGAALTQVNGGANVIKPLNEGMQASTKKIFLRVNNLSTLKGINGKPLPTSKGKITGPVINCMNGEDGIDNDEKDNVCIYSKQLQYPYKTSIEVKENISGGWIFDHWDSKESTCNKSTNHVCELDFTNKDTVHIAAFYENSIFHRIAFIIDNGAKGTVKVSVSKDGKIEQAEKIYEAYGYDFAMKDGYNVKAEAIPKKGWKFTKWSGDDCTCKNSPDKVCSLTTSKDETCFANFI